MREEENFRVFEKVRASKQKLATDETKLPKKRKFWSHYKEGEAPVEFVSAVEEHYLQIFILAKILPTLKLLIR